MIYRRKHLSSCENQPGENTCFVNNKYILFRKYCIFVLFLIFSAAAFSNDITTGADLQFAVQQGGHIDGALQSVKNIAWQVINVALFVGLIPVIRALSDGGEKGRKMLIGWAVALIIFQVAFMLV